MGTVKEVLGWLPESVWHITKVGSIDWRAFIKDRGDPRGVDKGEIPYSEFNPYLAERVYRYWAWPGAKVVDPFAGRTTRGLVAIGMGLDYEGYEVAPQTHKATCEQINQFANGWQPALGQSKLGSWVLHLEDGVEMKNTERGIADLVFTCPPYWRVEEYEQCIGQLSHIGDYSSFRQRIRETAVNCYQVLKPGGFCVWVVADFRFNGKFYPFHSDCIYDFASCGLDFWDIVINKLNSPYVTGAAVAKELKRTLKVHEYLLVWKKRDL